MLMLIRNVFINPGFYRFGLTYPNGWCDIKPNFLIYFEL